MIIVVDYFPLDGAMYLQHYGQVFIVFLKCYSCFEEKKLCHNLIRCVIWAFDAIMFIFVTDFNYFDNMPHDVVQEHRHRVNRLLHERFRIRDNHNPLDLPIPEFVKLYRMPPNAAVNLCNILRQYVPQRTSPQQTPLLRKVCGLCFSVTNLRYLILFICGVYFVQVLIALAFYATGSYQRMLGRSIDGSVCQTTVSRTVREITEALNHPDVLTQFIQFPLTREERAAVITR